MQGNNVPATTNSLGCLVRLLWLAFGNLALVLCLVGISQRPWSTVNYVDVICLVTVAALIGLRYVDIRYFAGCTSTGEPATMADWRSYSWRIVGLTIAAWCLARGYAWLSISS